MRKGGVWWTTTCWIETVAQQQQPQNHPKNWMLDHLNLNVWGGRTRRMFSDSSRSKDDSFPQRFRREYPPYQLQRARMSPVRGDRLQRQAVGSPLRLNAITVFPGDYGDNPELREGIERKWKESDDKDSESVTREGTKKLQEELRSEATAVAQKRKLWIDRYRNPPPQETQIDERGCSYARGARKRASARVWIQPGLGEITVNRQDYADYFVRESIREQILEPFLITETLGLFDVTATVQGGGHSGQAGAIRLGIAKCLNAYNPQLYRPALKFKGLLTRDARIVERKKAGLLKARKAPQWVRR